MAQIQAAVVREQGTTFAVVLVKNHVLNSQSLAGRAMQQYGVALGVPRIVLMGESNQKLRGNRRDVVNFVSRLHPSQLPWKKWTI